LVRRNPSSAGQDGKDMLRCDQDAGSRRLAIFYAQACAQDAGLVRSITEQT
jgi:hypothetical protein